MSEAEKDDVQAVLAEQERKERLKVKFDIWKNSPYPPKPKKRPFAFKSEQFITYTDGEKYVFRVVLVGLNKYCVGVAYINTPDEIVGILPPLFSRHIKLRHYLSPLTVLKILYKISLERGWKEYHE